MPATRPPSSCLMNGVYRMALPTPCLSTGRRLHYRRHGSDEPRSPRMKAFFVGDNRTNVNWGRAASIALRELLSREFEICGCVTGDFFDLSIAQAGLVGTLTPARFYGLVRRAWRDR